MAGEDDDRDEDDEDDTPSPPRSEIRAVKPDLFLPNFDSEDGGTLTEEGFAVLKHWWQENTVFDPDGAIEPYNKLPKDLDWTFQVSEAELHRAMLAAGMKPNDEEEGTYRARFVALGVDFGDAKPVHVRWLAKGLLPLGSVNMLAGAPGCLKTWAALSLQSAFAADEAWLGRFAFGELGDAVHVDLEMGADETNRRVAMLGGKRMGRIISPSVLPSESAFWTQLERLVPVDRYKHLHVTIDSLSRANEGLDEKDSRYGDAIAKSSRFVQKHNATVTWIHHSPKDVGSKTPLEIVRGHSSIVANLDTLYFLEKVSGAEAHQARVTCKKMRRGGRMPDPFVLQLTDERGLELVEPEGRTPKAAGVAAGVAGAEGGGGAGPSAPAVVLTKTEANDAAVLAAVRATPGIAGPELMRVTGIGGESALRDAVARLKDAGAIRAAGSNRNRRLYPAGEGPI